ncbi:MAG: YafY family transcriptional regulator [Caldilineaceae bacterium]|nr:YafY family transcriptional regulator [Caldilineaceae bacterium]
MNRIDRLFATLLLLQKRDVVRAEDLAAHFEISKRTVYRDVAALSEMGVPVISLPGEGYGLMPGYFLPPLLFTADEAAALVLGAQWLAQQATGRLPAATADAVAKLTHVLPKSTRHEVEDLMSILRFYVTNAPFDLHDPLLTKLQSAIRNQQPVQIVYHSLSGDERTERIIEPHLLTFGNGAWYVEAYCRLRMDRRSFRLSRIEHCMAVAPPFTQPLPDRRRPEKITVVVRFTQEAARWVRERQHYAFVQERALPEQCGEPRVEMIYAVDALYEIQSWIFGWGAQAEVVKPATLRQAILEEAHKLWEMLT